MSVLWVPSPDEGGGSSRLNTNLNLIFNSSKYGICRISSLKLKTAVLEFFPFHSTSHTEAKMKGSSTKQMRKQNKLLQDV